MPPTSRDPFQAALETCQDLPPGLHAAPEIAAPALPGLEEVLRALGPLPAETLFVGTAADGLPILHRLRAEEDAGEGSASPVIVLGDARSGKTAFLQMLARSLGLISEAGDIQFGAVTNYPEEWSDLGAMPASLGVWPGYHPSARDFLLQLTSWAESDRRRRNLVLLLVDDLRLFAGADADARRDLRFLLTHGPGKGIWPVVTINADLATGMFGWLNYFHARIFARTGRPALAEALAGRPHGDLDRLIPGVQYALQRPNGWLRFWIPAVEQERRES